MLVLRPRLIISVQSSNNVHATEGRGSGKPATNRSIRSSAFFATSRLWRRVSFTPPISFWFGKRHSENSMQMSILPCNQAKTTVPFRRPTGPTGR